MIRLITKEATYPLRKAVLRAGIPSPNVTFSIDEEPDTFNLGKFEEGMLIGIVTVGKGDIIENCINYNANCFSLDDYVNAYQLRGMAVDESFRNQDVGKSLIEAVEIELRKREITGIWCNARISALSFYEKQGFEILSEKFEVSQIGPHFVMGKQIN